MTAQLSQKSNLNSIKRRPNESGLIAIVFIIITNIFKNGGKVAFIFGTCYRSLRNRDPQTLKGRFPLCGLDGPPGADRISNHDRPGPIILSSAGISTSKFKDCARAQSARSYAI